MIISPDTFNAFRNIVFRLNADGSPAYAGYHPEIVEAPNGDGRLDTQKRYAHIATKYLPARAPGCGDLILLWQALRACHAEALRVHRALGLPEAWAPDLDASALRILEYPPGATSASHKDFDLFTLVAYRDPYPGGLVIDRATRKPSDREWGVSKQWPGTHYGELYELAGFGRATPHEVRATGPIKAGLRGSVLEVDVAQFSAVYFALPRHDLVLPDGRKVGPQTEPGTYLHERMGRSRVAR